MLSCAEPSVTSNNSLDIPMTASFVGYTPYNSDVFNAESKTWIMSTETVQDTTLIEHSNAVVVYIISCTLVIIGVIILIVFSTTATLATCYKFQRKKKAKLFEGTSLHYTKSMSYCFFPDINCYLSF